ncbi:MAG: helix-turn-helix domain-containing protein [Micrococcales bacterium]|nr:helix-turn-helix domain-containing protein [Micrococcales bacterium]
MVDDVVADPPELLGIGKASVFAGVSASTLRRYYAQGKIPAVRLPGGSLRFRQEDLVVLRTVNLSVPEGPRGVGR